MLNKVSLIIRNVFLTLAAIFIIGLLFGWILSTCGTDTEVIRETKVYGQTPASMKAEPVNRSQQVDSSNTSSEAKFINRPTKSKSRPATNTKSKRTASATQENSNSAGAINQFNARTPNPTETSDSYFPTHFFNSLNHSDPINNNHILNETNPGQRFESQEGIPQPVQRTVPLNPADRSTDTNP